MKHFIFLLLPLLCLHSKILSENRIKKPTISPIIKKQQPPIPAKKITPLLTTAKGAIQKMKEEAAKKKEGFINIQDRFIPAELPKICAL